MSAQMLGPEHISVMIWAAVHARPTEYELTTYTLDEPTPYNGIEATSTTRVNARRLRRGQTETLYGQFLVDAIAASVNARYNEDNAYIYEYRTPKHTEWSAVELLSAINCYEYQACEVTDWSGSEAKAFCDRLRRRIEGWLPRASEGPWAITPTTEPVIVTARREARARRERER